MAVWRVGYFASPCEFTPRHLCGWNHRYDDPKHEYRTIYAADGKKTCLREMLADLRKNKKVLADFEKTFGADDALLSAGKVTRAWREKHVLVQAKIKIASGTISHIEKPAVLSDLSYRLNAELSQRRIKRLSPAIMRKQDRELTRAASRQLYAAGHCGINFRSRLDKEPYYALFEGRARLDQSGEPLLLTDPLPELLAVCAEYALTLH